MRVVNCNPLKSRPVLAVGMAQIEYPISKYSPLVLECFQYLVLAMRYGVDKHLSKNICVCALIFKYNRCVCKSYHLSVLKFSTLQTRSYGVSQRFHRKLCATLWYSVVLCGSVLKNDELRCANVCLIIIMEAT